MELVLQFVGALGILVPFVLLQFGLIGPRAPVYLVLNLAGAGILAGVAVVEHQWGFVILQAVWALAAAWGLLRRSPDPA